MAGTQQPENPNRETPTTMKTQWQIHYARFFHFPSLPSKCPSLKPLHSRCKKDNPFGVWLSGSSTATVQLVYDQSTHGMVLTVTFKGEKYEEHYISRLHFSWPQVSCLEGCPNRGSRVVFASYRDSLGQVQKFALRFLQPSNSRTFICSLKAKLICKLVLVDAHSCGQRGYIGREPVGDFFKESLKDIGNVGHAISKFGSDITPPSEFVSLNGIHRRGTEEYTNASVLQNNGLPLQSLSRYASRQHTYCGTTALPHDSEATCVRLPSSFSALLSDSCTEAKQVLTGPLTCSLDSQAMAPPRQSPSNHEILRYICPEATTLSHKSEPTHATLPPIFSTLFPDPCSRAKQVAESPTVPILCDLNSQMMGCMTGSSFNVMLSKLEMAIEELGGGLAL